MNTIIDLFLKQVYENPDKTAVMDCRGTYSYAQLNKRSATLAKHILDRDIKAEKKRIGVLLPRTSDFFAAALGIIRTGCTLVPIDPEYPEERINTILEDAGCSLCISSADYSGKIKNVAAMNPEDYFGDDKDEEIDENLDLSDPDKEGLLLFTSGSTGRPKGVVHRQNIFSYGIHVLKDFHRFTGDDVTCCMAGLTFVTSIVDLYPPLMTGGSVYIANEKERKNVDKLYEVIKRRHVTGMYLPPQMFDVMRRLHGRLPLKYVMLAGEKTNTKYTDDGNILELYGATEAGVVLIHRISAEDPRLLGKTVGGAEGYLLSETGEKIDKPGVVGEFCVSGPFTALGYHNMPDETAAKFTENPFAPEKGLLYHTGDYMAYDEKGNYLFHGRRDRMVKIRSYRVELGEIESVLQKVKGVEETACVMIRVHGGEKLCCYYTGETKDTAALKEQAENFLPEYMKPDYYVCLDALPRNERNKVDYIALQGMEPPIEEDEYIPPETELEERVCDAFKDVLDLPRVSVLSNFFDLGGTSLSTALLVAKFEECSLSFQDVAEHPTPRMLADFIQNGAAKTPDKPQMDRDFYPLTKTQMGIYLEAMTGGNSATYTLSYLMKADPEITADRLIWAVNEVVAAHPSMKYVIRDGADGMPHMFMTPDEPVDIPIKDGEEKDRLEFISHYMPVVPMTDNLLFHFAVYRTPKRCYLALKSHLIFFDATSISLLISELNRALDCKEHLQEEYTIQQAGMREEQLVRDGMHEKARKYYTDLFRNMDDIQALQGDLDGDLTPGVSENLRYEPKTLTVERVKDFCDSCRISESTFFLGAMSILLGKYLNSRQISFSTVYNGRAMSGLEKTFGTLIKRIPVYGDLTENKTVKEYLKSIGQQILSTMGNDIYSFDEVMKNCPVNEDVEFLYQGDLFTDRMGESEAATKVAGDSYFMEHYHTGMVTGCMSIQFFSEDGLYNMTVEYRNERFSREWVEQFARGFFTISEGLLKSNLIGDISLLTDDDRKLIDSFNDTKVDMDFVPVHEQIRIRAQESPERRAVTAAGRTLTFGELNELSDRAARALCREGVKKDTLAGVLFDREVWAYVAELGILKAGGAFVPFIPGYPDERIEFCIEDGSIPVLLTSRKIREQRPGLGKNCRLIAIEDILDNPVPDIALPEVNAHDLAYCIYTSGTTGRPKGVMIEHKNIANYVHKNEKSQEIMHYAAPGRVCLALSSFSFDVSVVEEFVPLCNGCQVVIATEEEIHTPAKLSKLICDNDVTGITCTPTYLLGLLDIPESRETIKRISFFDVGAEAFPSQLFDRLRELRSDSVILNVYGPTEATMGCASEEMNSGGVVTVGKPIANTKFYIVDKFDQELPVGIKGELLICGDQVGRGYINLPDKTADAFITYNGVVAYRSGDLAAWTPEGKIRVFGRIDNQIKLRGFRIEIDEIEKVMMEYEGVGSAAVSLIKKGTMAYLAAYYTSQKEIVPDDLKVYMHSKLPEYMIPSAFVKLEAMPMTPNGKVDKKNLPQPDVSAFQAKYEPPATEYERILCRAFAETLNLPEEKVSVLDDFFELGGDSLKSMAVLAKADLTELSAADIFQKRTPREIAAVLEERKGQENIVELETRARKTQLPLTPLQTLMLDIQLFRPDATMWSNMHFLARFDPSEVDAEKLCNAVNIAVKNHPVLSSAFSFNEHSDLIQQYVPGFVKDVKVKEISKETEEMLPNVLVVPFPKVMDSCLHRIEVFRSPEYVYLFMDIHHLLIDGTSFGILLSDVANAYFDRELEPDYYFALRVEEQKKLKNGGYWKSRDWFNARYLDEVWCRLPLSENKNPRRNDTDLGTKLKRLNFVNDDIRKAEEFWGVSHSVMGITAALTALARFTGKQHVMLNWIFNSRLNLESKNTVGMLIKNMYAALKTEEFKSMREMLHSVKEQVTEGIAHSDYDDMVEKYEPYVNDCLIYDLQIAINGDELDVLNPTFIEIDDELTTAASPLEIDLLENEYGDEVYDSMIEYSKGMYSSEVVEAFHELYIRIFEDIVSCDETMEILG